MYFASRQDEWKSAAPRVLGGTQWLGHADRNQQEFPWHDSVSLEGWVDLFLLFI